MISTSRPIVSAGSGNKLLIRRREICP